jgi:hypothetical protein
MGEVFASAPFIVGKSEPSPTEADIPAEEALCPVISHDWVNEEYKHLVVAASPKALCGCGGRKASIASTAFAAASSFSTSASAAAPRA